MMRLLRSACVLLGCAVILNITSGCSGSKHSAEKQPFTASPSSAPASTVHHFVPESFTAIGDDDYWLLGTVECPDGRCFSILRTANGGRSFERVAAPQLPTKGGIVPMLRFADLRDGFAFVRGVGGVVYATHDGGASWRKLRLRTLLAFATAGGNAYAVTASCSIARCSGYRFQRSPVSRTAWNSTALPFTPDGSIVDLAARGMKVWLLATPAGSERAQRDALARSSDGGRTFVIGPGPCYPGLGGELAPTSARVVWGVCPTGMMAAVSRSTDGGNTFSNLVTPPLVNSATLAPASSRTAVLARNGARSRLLRTTDGGRTWKPATTPGTAAYIPWIGFTDANVGAALVQTGYDRAARTETQALWRTTDGGAHWHTVRFR